MIEKYIIGIDFGHAETSFAMCRICLDKSIEELKYEIVYDNEEVVPSAIAYYDGRAQRIGIEAFDACYQEEEKDFHLEIGFKTEPKNIEGSKEKIMIDFMRLFYNDKVLNSFDNRITKENHYVYIAAPSGWSETTRNLYLEMAKLAGIPVVGITKESRAAFFNVWADRFNTKKRVKTENTLIIDVGSSTVDFTYTNQYISEPMIDVEENVGASQIEESLLDKLRKNYPIIDDFCNEFPLIKNTLIYRLREFKENHNNKKSTNPIDFRKFVKDEKYQKTSIQFWNKNNTTVNSLIVVGPEFYSDIEEEYVKKFKLALNKFKENHLKDTSLENVILTGGGSNLLRIKDKNLIAEILNIDSSSIYIGGNPTKFISNGIAETGRYIERYKHLKTLLSKEESILIHEDPFETRELKKGDWAFITTNLIMDEINMFYYHKIRDILSRNINNALQSSNFLDKVFNKKNIFTKAIEDTKKQIKKESETIYSNDIRKIVIEHLNKRLSAITKFVPLDEINTKDLSSLSIPIDINIEIEVKNFLNELLCIIFPIIMSLENSISSLANYHKSVIMLWKSITNSTNQKFYDIRKIVDSYNDKFINMEKMFEIE